MLNLKSSMFSLRASRHVVAALFVFALVGCGGGGGGVTPDPTVAPTVSSGPAGGVTTPASAAPSISGSPPTVILVASAFSFRPSVTDPSGKTLHFSIAGQPSWMTFDSTAGTLTGTPAPADVGSYAITVAVSDGSQNASLQFTLAVVQAAAGRATVSWVPPVNRTDGAPLQNLAGFRVYYGTLPGTLANILKVAYPGATSAVVDNLTPGTWYFAATAVDSHGLESAPSQTASKKI